MFGVKSFSLQIHFNRFQLAWTQTFSILVKVSTTRCTRMAIIHYALSKLNKIIKSNLCDSVATTPRSNQAPTFNICLLIIIRYNIYSNIVSFNWFSNFEFECFASIVNVQSSTRIHIYRLQHSSDYWLHFLVCLCWISAYK